MSAFASKTAHSIRLACRGHHLPQGRQLDSTRNKSITDDEAGRPVDAERVREIVIALYDLVDLRRFQVALHRGDIEPCVGGSFENHLLRNLTCGSHHRRVEGLVLSLLDRRERDMSREYRLRPEYRKFLVDDTKFRILLQQRLDQGRDLFAIRAPIVEELDDGNIACRIARARG